MADGAVRLLGRLAGQGDDLDDLLGGEGGRPSRARGVVEDLLGQGRELLVGEVVPLGASQIIGGLEPAVAPEADGDAVESQVSGDGFEARIVGQGEQEANPADQALRGGLALTDAFERSPLSGRELEGHRMRAAHEPPRFMFRG
jgi:hypothetical protein